MTGQKEKYPRRVRNALRFRTLSVLQSVRVAPGFQRVIVGGPALEGFSSAGFDDHIKLFFPDDPASFQPPQATDEGIVWQSDERPPSRDYTPLYDAGRHELAIDFYLHDDGVASNWAQRARPGDKLFIGGPRGSLIVPEQYGWQLYVCDETGMPALRRRLEALSVSGHAAQITAIVAVADAASKAYLAHLSGFNIEWVVGGDEQAIARRLSRLTVPRQDYFLWITGEGKAVKRLSARFETPAIDPQLLRAVAYWHAKG
ncbi:MULTISPECIES: siderophore-interacting protein [Tenebrionibacter/Tenebrionicola group]|jgi:ferric-chelate reductase (NADPH)|uniref:Siderophore-interacting protein n=2 Tax=Tenebrionibacter/Tenebrionicola group TaxID=2969848 RepID=A0A8K0V2J1_9ENTR|nr:MULTISPECIES: siderophore-interacting protein [Tenebrionibacter/Tenebrionicola group]MBK4715616.1 siderophore-interacting protein [Tenebrionibacter intestinalis]MBV5094600.1 siderophore-interacting protein [Tenebrionicola larvae]